MPSESLQNLGVPTGLTRFLRVQSSLASSTCSLKQPPRNKPSHWNSVLLASRVKQPWQTITRRNGRMYGDQYHATCLSASCRLQRLHNNPMTRKTDNATTAAVVAAAGEMQHRTIKAPQQPATLACMQLDSKEMSCKLES